MKRVVMKFGGSSVADVAKLRRVAQQVVSRRRAGEQVVVAVSAMGKSTDALIAQAREVLAEPPQRELDMLVTAGERVAMALLSMAICGEGEQAISFTGSQSGIITEDKHQGARIIEVRPQRITEALEAGRIVIVAGFQGVSTKREITTLGRGGTDTTAVALAAALVADACEIYSDVDGVYTADPNVCDQARLLPELRYETMQAMASVGAKVLHAECVEFARRAGIAIHARKTGDDSGKETVVSGKATAPTGVVAVVGAQVVSWLEGRRIDAAALYARLDGCGARVMQLSAGGATSALVDRTGVPGKDEQAVARIAGELGLESRAVGLVSLVGAGLSGRAELVGKALAELSGIEVAACFAHDATVSLVVPVASTDEAVRRLHRAFV